MSRAEQPPGTLNALDGRLGPPPKLVFPEGWTLSGAWKRAQSAEAYLGPTEGRAHYDVLLGRENGDMGDKHRVLFAIQNGALRADCDCKAHQYRDWCAHVAVLWWRWTRGRITVRNLDTDQTHVSPPWWLAIPDEETI
ncbi:SWIM zinc finger family protein [Halobacterium wangiae]|uniref:SWIM zinc finger family protein n=1 Tax=Halobacterium wangiae TaxID=2902623 RepID=UPI001E55E023|nr:SWIM zinc finger family protein [Halobacterium wangiae]